jgi:formate hydrogenlyase subunit 4
MYTALIIANTLAIPLLSPAAIGIIRKIKARIQNRTGADILQPYRDIFKLFKKDEVISEDASWIFTFSPYFVFATTLVLAAGVPLIHSSIAWLPAGDILVFVYLLAAGTFFLALSGIDTGGGFGGFGASREMMIAALVEGGLILSLAAVALMAETTNLSGIMTTLSLIPDAHLLPLALAGVAFFIALLAEDARYPVDNPATHLELTMVHEAMILEHSGKGLALMEWAAANKFLIFIAVFVNVFQPFGLAESLSLLALFIAAVIFFAKVFVALFVIAFIESAMSKFRIFRVPDFLFTSYILSVIAILTFVI